MNEWKVVEIKGPYLSWNERGEKVYKTFDQVNAELMASAKPQLDPTKPTKLPQMLCGSVRGCSLIEAKQRNPNKAFLHIVSWNEFKPYLCELVEAGEDMSDVEDLEQYNDDGSINDMSWDNIATTTNELRASILERILKKRGADLKRGDAIRMQFVNYRCYGIYFYDGDKVILPADEDSDYYHLPHEFKVPTEFSMDYWEDFVFTGYSRVGDYCFDVKAIEDFSKIRKVNMVEEKDGDKDFWIVYHFKIQEDPWNLILINGGQDESDKILQTFFENGLCYDHYDKISDKELKMLSKFLVKSDKNDKVNIIVIGEE